jgi:hypothetical protein
MWLISREACAPNPLAHLGKPTQRNDTVVGAELQLTFLVGGFLDIDQNVAHIDDGGAAISYRAVEVDEFMGHKVIEARQVERGRRQLNAVLKINTAYSYR